VATAETAIEPILSATRARLCLTCGKCTAVCPVSRMGGDYSPRRFVEQVVTGSGSLADDSALWDCLTCSACYQVCPSNVDFVGLVREVREAAPDRTGARCTHGDAIGAWVKLMAEGFAPNRLGWLEDTDLQTASDSDTIFFVGCLPFYAPVFEPIGAECLEIAHSAIRVLNALGIAPQVRADEVCCGHDQLWSGDVATFRKLAERNVAMLRASGATRVVTACPECARTLKIDYPKYVEVPDLEILHLSELVVGTRHAVSLQGAAKNGREPRTVTFHDPCRLGRHLGIYDAPRTALTEAGFEVVEMHDSRHHATCCGTSLWMNCGAVNKRIQVERLRQAAATGAEVLVTACPKCQMHFKCALDDPDVSGAIRIEVRDLTTLLAETDGRSK
jgi:heterodisulfide reductase subunit D